MILFCGKLIPMEPALGPKAAVSKAVLHVEGAVPDEGA